MPRSERSPMLLAGLLAAAGVAHFTAPRRFDAIVATVNGAGRS